MPAPSERLRLALAAVFVLTACGASKKKPSGGPDAAASVATSDSTSYLFAGEQVPRFTHWTKSGDLVAVSAGALWRLPAGELGADATIVDTRMANGSGVGHERTFVSVYDTDGANERWLLGGEGFVSVRDPHSLAEIRRIAVNGTVDKLVLAKNANVALVHACPDNACTITRIQLDTGAQADLGRASNVDALTISPDGKLAAFLRDERLLIVAGDAAQPAFTSASSSGEESATAVFLADGNVLFGANKQVGRWNPTAGKSATLSLHLPIEGDAVMVADPVLGRIVASQTYSGDVSVYDGSAVRVLELPEPGCGSAHPALDDPTQLECPQLGTRIDAAGASSSQPLGVVLRFTDKYVLRIHNGDCEVVERATARIVSASAHGLCRAHFSPDGTRLAWVGDDGVLRVQPVAEPTRDTVTVRTGPVATVQNGTWLARWDDTLASFGPSGFQRISLSGAYNGRLELSHVASFRVESGRVIGTDFTGKERLRAVDLGWGRGGGTKGYQPLYASGTSVVSGAYGHEAKFSVCRLDAECTQFELAPATHVKAYDAPWIVTSVSDEPDAPAQMVYYVRHDDAQEPPRRVIVGRDCKPAAVLQHGDQLACISGDTAVLFDTKTGQPLGDGAPLDLERSLAPEDATPRSLRRERGGINRFSSNVVGHDDAALFVRTSEWLDQVVHIEARALPAALDAGAAAAAVPSVAVLSRTYALVRYADGSVRVGGDVAQAERSLACRRGNELLPWSACKRASLR